MTSAKIARVAVVRYRLRFREPYVTARGRLDERELVLLRLDANGVEGIGETAPLSLRGGIDAATIAAELSERCVPRLEGSTLEGEDVFALADDAADGASLQGRAAVELALLDLAGKLAGKPVWRLLGAREARPVECNATLAAGEPDAVAARARRWAERGFETFKLKVGLEVERDIQQVRAVRASLGTRARIRIDANGAWTVDEAVARLRALEPFGIELVEQPSASLEDLGEVRRHTRVPIAADESVVTAADGRAARAVGCDAATVKLAKVGGIRAALAIGAALPVYLSSALDGPVGIAAAVHTAQALPCHAFSAGLAHGLATGELFEGSVATAGPELSGCRLLAPERPGLGVELDEGELERRRL